jgi:DNA-binding transcriptional ArsR family regulator
VHVLGTLVEALLDTGLLEEGETTVRLSRREIAERTGLSVQQVQRALTSLAEQGYIARVQRVKRDGEVADTLLLPKAFEALGIAMERSGDVNVGAEIPRELAELLVGESRDVVDAVVAAWSSSCPLDQRIGSRFRGGARRWAEIEFLVGARVEAKHVEMLDALERAKVTAEAEARGEYAWQLPDGTQVLLSADAYRSCGRSPAQRSVDMRFVRCVLVALASKRPDLVTRERLPGLIAEIAYSRTVGFVRRHDAAPAIRVLASCVARPTWSWPRGMGRDWLTLAEASVHPQGVRSRFAN